MTSNTIPLNTYHESLKSELMFKKSKTPLRNCKVSSNLKTHITNCGASKWLRIMWLSQKHCIKI